MQEAGSTEDVPACFAFGIVLFINAAIWRKTTMEFFNQAITVLQTLVVAIGAGLGVWGVVNLMEGYVTNSNEGEGLLFYGNTIIPFKDKFDTSLKLYSLMTTKPNEMGKYKEKKEA